MTTFEDLPPHALACSLELVDAVQTYDQAKVAHTLRQAAEGDGLEALAVCLAALVDDSKTLRQLLAWVDNGDVRAWRRALSDAQCREFRAAHTRGDRSAEVIDGNREWEGRRAARRRARAAVQLREKQLATRAAS